MLIKQNNEGGISNNSSVYLVCNDDDSDECDEMLIETPYDPKFYKDFEEFEQQLNNHVDYQRVGSSLGVAATVNDYYVTEDASYILLDRIDGKILGKYYIWCFNKGFITLYIDVVDKIITKYLALLSKNIKIEQLSNQSIIVDNDNNPYFLDFGFCTYLKKPLPTERVKKDLQRLITNISFGNNVISEFLTKKYITFTLY